MSAKNNEPSRTYLLMSTDSQFLARAQLESPPDARNMQLRITEGDPGGVVDAELIHAVPMDDDMPVRMGRVILRRGKLVVLEPLKDLGMDMRRNLRMPVYFESLIYFEHGGRALIRAADLSCGGIAFYSTAEMSVGERFEVVIPITSVNPSILHAEVLRIQPYTGQVKLFACKFVDLLNEEEERVREAVFHVQVRRGRAVKATAKA